MKIQKSYFFIIIFIFLNFTQAISAENFAFINLDKILKKSDYGKISLNKIQNINDKNIMFLKNKENDLKKDEENLNKKKNILSDEEFQKELNLLRNKINDYRNTKDQLVKDFDNKRSGILNNFFSNINPIIQEYMNKNSIEILFEQKNVFIGKTSSDITNIIIEEINKKKFE